MESQGFFVAPIIYFFNRPGVAQAVLQTSFSLNNSFIHYLTDKIDRGYISNLVLSRATGDHWNQPGHSLADLKVVILEQTRNNSEEYRKEREKFFIRLFDKYNTGLNKEV